MTSAFTVRRPGHREGRPLSLFAMVENRAIEGVCARLQDGGYGPRAVFRDRAAGLRSAFRALGCISATSGATRRRWKTSTTSSTDIGTPRMRPLNPNREPTRLA